MAGESQHEPAGGAADPTVLTTEQMLLESARQREIMLAETHRLEDLFIEKFKSIESELILVERQRVEQKQDTKSAVDSALTAQKEAVKEQTTASERAIAKSEAATTKSIEQLGDKFDTAIDGLRREVADLKERVTGAEGVVQGGSEVKQRQDVTLGQIIAVVAVAVTAIGVLAAITTAITTLQ